MRRPTWRDRIRACLGLDIKPTRGLSLTHMGFTVGYHGDSLEHADEQTREFINEVKEAADRSAHIVHRIFYKKGKPLNVVLIGRDYAGVPAIAAHKLTNLLIKPEDLILGDSKYHIDELKFEFKGKVKDVKLNGIRSTVATPLEEQEIYGPYSGTRSERNAYVAKSLIAYAKSGNFKRIYQHCLSDWARFPAGKFDPDSECIRFDRTIPSEVEGAGLNYLVLMPREVEEPTQEVYEYATVLSADRKLADREGRFLK